jgi:hypothetical protein
MKLGYKTAWFILLLTTAAIVAMVFTPVWLIKPFSPQTERQLAVSFFLKSWSPVLTVLLAIAAVALTVFIWKNTKRWYGKAPLIIPLVVIGIFTWFAQQNHFEWMFAPLENARFAKASETDFVADDDMVLAVKIGDDAVAFPVLQMAYHHVAQETVGGTPITATY